MARIEFQHLYNFSLVARHRSFRRAAEELNVSPSSLSHSMRVLEDCLGVRLLNRTTRSVVLTEVGASLLSKIEYPLKELEEAIDSVNRFRASLQGTLRLNVPRAAGKNLLMPIIGSFLRQHPQVRAEIVTDDGIVDIVERGFDAGVRFGESVALDMVGIPIGPPQKFVLVASPKMVERFGLPKHPTELKKLPCIARKFPSGILYAWEFFDGTQQISIKVESQIHLDDDEMMIRAALDDLGYAFVYIDFAAKYIASGELIAVLEDWCLPMPGFFLYYPDRRNLSVVFRSFIEWIKESANQASSSWTSVTSVQRPLR